MWNEIQQYLFELYKQNQFLQGGVILGFVTSIGYYLKQFLPKLWTRIERHAKIHVTIEQHESQRLYTFIENWLRVTHEKEYRSLKAKLYDIEYGTIDNPSAEKLDLSVEKTETEKQLNTEGTYPEDSVEAQNTFINTKSELRFEQVNDYFYILYKGRYIRISQTREKLDHASNLFNMHSEIYKFSAWFGKKQINQLLTEIINWGEAIEAAKKEKTTISIYNADAYGNTAYLQDVDIKKLNRIIIEEKDKLIDDIDIFLKSKSWYKQRAIPYKRGFLFEGLPGNGKTTLALSLAQYFKKDIIVANLSKMENIGLERLFTQQLTSSNILLLEDIDAMVQERRDLAITPTGDVKEKKTVNLSTLLNCMDGVFSKKGSIVIMTTNHPERLDPALIRHGRIDYIFTITNPNLTSINTYLSDFFQRNLSIELKEEYAENLSMVDVQTECIRHRDNVDAVMKAVTKLAKTKELNGTPMTESRESQ